MMEENLINYDNLSFKTIIKIAKSGSTILSYE